MLLYKTSLRVWSLNSLLMTMDWRLLDLLTKVGALWGLLAKALLLEVILDWDCGMEGLLAKA